MDAPNDLALLKAEGFAALPAAAKLKEANTKEREFDDMVKDAKKAAVLVY